MSRNGSSPGDDAGQGQPAGRAPQRLDAEHEKAITCDYPAYKLNKLISAKFAASGSPAVGLVKVLLDQRRPERGLRDDRQPEPDARAAARRWVEANPEKVAAWLIRTRRSRATVSPCATPRTSSPQSSGPAVSILDLLAGAGELGVTELARRLDVHKSTASRLVAALEKSELVEQVDARGGYRLGVGLLPARRHRRRRSRSSSSSQPVCRRLAQETGLTVDLAVLCRATGRCLGPGRRHLRPAVLQLGRPARIPLHATSNGKVLLSRLDPRRVSSARQPVAHSPRRPSPPASAAGPARRITPTVLPSPSTSSRTA